MKYIAHIYKWSLGIKTTNKCTLVTDVPVPAWQARQGRVLKHPLNCLCDDKFLS